MAFVHQVTMLEVPLFTPEECIAVAEATAEAISRPGFSPTSFLLDPSTEVPVQDLPTEVRFPFRGTVYRDCFVVKGGVEGVAEWFAEDREAAKSKGSRT